VVASIHLPGVVAFPPAGQPVSAEGQAFVARQQRWRDAEGGYAHQQATRPQTLACGLGDSPAGLACGLPFAGPRPAGLTARTEAIYLEPHRYGTCSGWPDRMRRRRVHPAETPYRFMHTGGLPGLFGHLELRHPTAVA